MRALWGHAFFLVCLPLHSQHVGKFLLCRWHSTIFSLGNSVDQRLIKKGMGVPTHTHAHTQRPWGKAELRIWWRPLWHLRSELKLQYGCDWMVGSTPLSIKEMGRDTVRTLSCTDDLSSLYLCMLSCVWLFVTPRTVPHQAHLSMGFSRQEYWSGLRCPSPWDLPSTGIQPASQPNISNHWRYQSCISLIWHRSTLYGALIQPPYQYVDSPKPLDSEAYSISFEASQ